MGKDRFLTWIHQSEFDLAASKLSHESNFFEWSCYQCVQAVEKALKSVLVHSGIRPPKIHKLGVLLSMCNEANPEFMQIKLNFRYVESFTFISRYPFIIPGGVDKTPHELISKEDSKALITISEKIVEEIKNFLLHSSRVGSKVDMNFMQVIFTVKEVEERLQSVIQTLQNMPEILVEKIILFGSFAKNKSRPKSATMDLLIVGETNLSFFDRITRVRELTKGGFPIIEPLVYTNTEFHQMLEEEGEGFLETAVDEGHIIWQRTEGV